MSSINQGNPFASVPCPMWRTAASTGRMKVDPETGFVSNREIYNMGRQIGADRITAAILPPAFRIFGMNKEWKESASKWDVFKEGVKRLFSPGGNIYELKGGLADGRGALGNGVRGKQLDELEQFAKNTGGDVNGETRITKLTMASWQEQHLAKVGEMTGSPVEGSERNMRTIELTLPFFLFSRTDLDFHKSRDHRRLTSTHFCDVTEVFDMF